jgi:1,2-diacylglycerol 3-alpha-glucosyltransferase
VEKFKPSPNKSELRRKLNITEEKKIVLSLGNLVEHKQPYKLIKVFSLAERNLRHVILIVAGGGDLLEKTKKLAKQSGLDSVRFLGHIDHEKAPELYACSDFFVITSNWESGGPTLTVAEAMASGLPCIVSNIPSLSPVIQDADCGIVVDFSDEEKAAERIIGYLKEDHSQHSKNGREYAVKNLDWKIIAKRYLEELESL